MSQVCDYEIHARGSHGAVLALYSSINNYDQAIDSLARVGSGDAVIRFHGTCMNDPDWGCLEAEDSQDKKDQPTDNLRELTLRAKSAVLQLEIEVYANDGEGLQRFDSYDHGDQKEHGYRRQEFSF